MAPLTDRVEDWKRTVNQMDRDTMKELRKARSELQRATVEAEKWRKRLRRKASVYFVGNDSDCWFIHTGLLPVNTTLSMFSLLFG